MLRLICLSKSFDVCRINIIVFFSLLLMLSIQCLADLLNDKINNIDNIKSYSIVSIVLSSIILICVCFKCEDNKEYIEETEPLV
jgi:hypothetical protein|uniref:Uncharacterized protein n=1 Tax=Mimiviridae sp. ChoanoV1 TaxID=2596887 RepID=A0A5B8IHK8_9VIRU|nr:hypothetical protein 1_147 [Mimiviridae sp. ChoanoV1]